VEPGWSGAEEMVCARVQTLMLKVFEGSWYCGLLLDVTVLLKY